MLIEICKLQNHVNLRHINENYFSRLVFLISLKIYYVCRLLQDKKKTKFNCVNKLPLTGAPSIISYFAIVKLSVNVLGPDPVVSRLIIAISICLIFILTSKK